MYTSRETRALSGFEGLINNVKVLIKNIQHPDIPNKPPAIQPHYPYTPSPTTPTRTQTTTHPPTPPCITDYEPSTRYRPHVDIPVCHKIIDP